MSKVSTAARATSILPFAPRPCRGEIMSSWLSRVGCRYGLEPANLLARLDPNPDMSSSRELDWNMSDRHQSCLADATRLERARVAELDPARSHANWAQQWFAWASIGRDPWQNEDIYDYEFRWAWCPRCLAEGHALTGQDYIRLPWTLACVGYCHAHRIPLTSECNCGALVRPIHVAEGDRSRLVCRSCERPIGSGGVQDGLKQRSLSPAADLQIAFEQDLILALNDAQPIHDWCGVASNEQLLAV